MEWGVKITFGTSALVLLLVLIIKTNVHRSLKMVIGFIILIGLITDGISSLIPLTPSLTQFIFNAYVFFSSICLWGILFLAFRSKRERQISSIVFGVFLFGMIFFSIIENRLDFNNGIWSSLQALIGIAYSFYYFFKQLNIAEEIKITATPKFWIFSGFLIYFGGTFVLSLFYDLMVGLPPIVIAYVWPIMNVMTILFHITLIKAIWTMRKT